MLIFDGAERLCTWRNGKEGAIRPGFHIDNSLDRGKRAAGYTSISPDCFQVLYPSYQEEISIIIFLCKSYTPEI